MRLPKKLRKAAIRAHADGVDPTAFIEQHHAAILAAADGSCGAYRSIRCEIMRVVVNGPETSEKGAKP